MTTWKDGGRRGEIVSDEGDFICIVQTVRIDSIKTEPWPEGEANFALILQALKMLEALETIVSLGNWREEKEIVCNSMEEIARAAIAAVKGDSSDEKAELV
jgi:hypothetical protein